MKSKILAVITPNGIAISSAGCSLVDGAIAYEKNKRTSAETEISADGSLQFGNRLRTVMKIGSAINGKLKAVYQANLADDSSFIMGFPNANSYRIKTGQDDTLVTRNDISNIYIYI